MDEIFISFLSKIPLEWIIISIIPGGLGVYCWRFICLQKNIINNLQRKIYFLKVSENNCLQTEKEVLEKTKLFRIDSDIKNLQNDLRVLQNFSKKSVFIIGYDVQYTQYKEIIHQAEKKNIPVIVYAKHHDISKEHHQIFSSYIYSDIVNSSHRLATTILNIFSFPL